MMVTINDGLAWGKTQIGKPYSADWDKRFGPNAYDCSGFVTRVLERSGMVPGSLPTNSADMCRWLLRNPKYRLDRATARNTPGAIILLGGTDGYGPKGHVGFSLSGGKTLEAASSRGVQIYDFDRLAWGDFMRAPGVIYGAEPATPIPAPLPSPVPPMLFEEDDMRLVRGTDTPHVWLVTGPFKHHITAEFYPHWLNGARGTPGALDQSGKEFVWPQRMVDSLVDVATLARK
jgi:hypothetical protein